MLLTIFRHRLGVSYESHFFGAVGGMLSAFLFRHRDPMPARKVYSWERETEEDEDPVIGDLWKPEYEQKAFSLSAAFQLSWISIGVGRYKALKIHRLKRPLTPTFIVQNALFTQPPDRRLNNTPADPFNTELIANQLVSIDVVEWT